MILNRSTTRIVTIVLIIFATLLSGVGGMSDILQKPLYLSKEHAWRDSTFLLLIAILLNVMV